MSFDCTVGEPQVPPYSSRRDIASMAAMTVHICVFHEDSREAAASRFPHLGKDFGKL